MGVWHYKSRKLSNGSRIVTRMKPGASICLDILKFFRKRIVFLYVFLDYNSYKITKKEKVRRLTYGKMVRFFSRYYKWCC